MVYHVFKFYFFRLFYFPFLIKSWKWFQAQIPRVPHIASLRMKEIFSFLGYPRVWSQAIESPLLKAKGIKCFQNIVKSQGNRLLGGFPGMTAEAISQSCPVRGTDLKE